MEPFRYRIVVGWDEEDETFVARVPALEGCIAHGSTEAQAVREARTAGGLMLSAMREHGDRIPAEDAGASSYSGNIRLRIPRSLHARLDALAAAEGVSLNQLMVALLARGAGSVGHEERFQTGEVRATGVAEATPRSRRSGEVPVTHRKSKGRAAKAAVVRYGAPKKS